MSIEVKKPTHEFYDSLDDVITHQVKSREAFDRAIEIARKQGFQDYRIGIFIKDYLRDKIPKTSLYRYLRELVPLERLDKPPGYEMYNALQEVIDKVEEFRDNLRDLLDHWGEYKMEAKLARLKPKGRKALERLIRQYAKHLRTFNMILESFHDDRYSYSKIRWFQIAADINEHGYGYAANKYKVEIIDDAGNKTGKYWKFTRKQIKKMMPGLVQDMIDFKDALEFFQRQYCLIESKNYENTKIIQELLQGFFALSDWRDVHSDYGGVIAGRRAKLSPKLSETAFGAD